MTYDELNYDLEIEKMLHPENFSEISDEDLQQQERYDELLSEPEYSEDYEPTQEVFEERVYEAI